MKLLICFNIVSVSHVMGPRCSYQSSGDIFYYVNDNAGVKGSYYTSKVHINIHTIFLLGI